MLYLNFVLQYFLVKINAKCNIAKCDKYESGGVYSYFWESKALTFTILKFKNEIVVILFLFRFKLFQFVMVDVINVIKIQVMMTG